MFIRFDVYIHLFLWWTCQLMELTVFGIGVGTMNNMLQRTFFLFWRQQLYLFIYFFCWNGNLKKNFLSWNWHIIFIIFLLCWDQPFFYIDQMIWGKENWLWWWNQGIFIFIFRNGEMTHYLIVWRKEWINERNHLCPKSKNISSKYHIINYEDRRTFSLSSGALNFSLLP